jgi:RIO-like serine/threonine protein kinase
LEKIEGRPASFQDLSVCEAALGKLHELGLVHGDVNRYNFLVTEEGVKLLDFKRLREKASPELVSKELESLRAELSTSQDAAEVSFSMAIATDLQAREHLLGNMSR